MKRGGSKERAPSSGGVGSLSLQEEEEEQATEEEFPTAKGLLAKR